MTRNTDPHFNLADALSEDIVAAHADALVYDARTSWRPTDADKVALLKIARLYANKVPYEHEDLLQAAICRALSGQRTWPRDLAALPFLRDGVRGIAWAWKKRTPGTMPDPGVSEGEECRFADSSDVAGIIALFEDDPAAQIIVRGMMEGARRHELQDLSGLDKTEYESKRTEIRRRVDKFWRKAIR